MIQGFRLASRTPIVAVLLAASLALTACGDDDDDKDSGDENGSSLPQAKQRITITATGTAKAPKFKVSPKTAKPGAATIVLKNGLGIDGLDGQLVYFDENYTDKEVAAQFANAVSGKPVQTWFLGGGGPGQASKGGTSSVTQDLKAGTYVVLPGEDAPKLPLTRFQVKGKEGDKVEPPAATITATEYSYKAKGVKSGEAVLLKNAGQTWHHFLGAKLKPRAKIEDALKFLKTNKGKSPFVKGDIPLASTVLDEGYSQVVEFSGGPGNYAVYCFISDKQGGGPPHVQEGMVSQVVVK